MKNLSTEKKFKNGILEGNILSVSFNFTIENCHVRYADDTLLRTEVYSEILY